MGHEQTERALFNMYQRLGTKTPDNYNDTFKSNYKLNTEITTMKFNDDD